MVRLNWRDITLRFNAKFTKPGEYKRGPRLLGCALKAQKGRFRKEFWAAYEVWKTKKEKEALKAAKAKAKAEKSKET